MDLSDHKTGTYLHLLIMAVTGAISCGVMRSLSFTQHFVPLRSIGEFRSVLTISSMLRHTYCSPLGKTMTPSFFAFSSRNAIPFSFPPALAKGARQAIANKIASFMILIAE